jgi:hypothetical protein
MLLTQLILSFLLFTHYPPQIATTEQLIKAMQDRYKGKWSRTVTFTQYNTHYAADTIKTQSVWHEAIQFPDKFRIDFGKISEGNAVIFAQDSAYTFKDGQLKSSRLQVNNLLLLTGGLFFISPEDALSRLKEAGYNLSIFREDTWEGEPVYVVGALKGDDQASQLWISKTHLYLLRTITQSPDHHIQEAQFRKHVRMGGGWIETEVLFLKDGQRQQLEVYKDIKANAKLAAELFRPEHFGKVHWKKEGDEKKTKK